LEIVTDVNNAYRLLGIEPGASEREIRRAYRRVVVNTHRSGVLNLIDRLNELSRAYESLKDPLHRNGIRDAIERSVWSPPRLPIATGIRSEATREVQRLSERVGAKAQSENAPVVEELVAEFDRREAAARRALLWRKRRDMAIRVVWLAILAALVVGVARRLGRY
jgi:curved DNA-binding protein CbpA